ncbi:MAG TPA: hypothetical protein PKW90_18670, partial [Myxococcota bacterium]|nr:hypothetical protein [Myxococcota bacterium]
MPPDFFGSQATCRGCGVQGGPAELPTVTEPDGLEAAGFRQVARRQCGAALRLLSPWSCTRCGERNLVCISRNMGGSIFVLAAAWEAPEQSDPHYVAEPLWPGLEQRAPDVTGSWNNWREKDTALWKCLDQGRTLAALQKSIFDYRRSDLLRCYWGFRQALGDLLLSAELAWERSDSAVFGWAHQRIEEGRAATDAACADPQMFLCDEEKTVAVVERLGELERVYEERYGLPPEDPERTTLPLPDDIFVPSPYASLHPVGYFRELPYGDADGPSLVESVRQEAAWEEEK